MMRCPYISVPSDVSQLTVSVHVTSAGLYSNGVTLSLTSTSSNASVTNPNVFGKVVRYQCRDIVVIPNILDNNIYDPLQSEDPHIAYPLDFYAMNIGGALSAYVSAQGSNSNLAYWDCPPILTPGTTLSSASQASYATQYNLNMNLFSESSSSPVLYPVPSGSADATMFYLAKTRQSVFTVPVNAYVAPTIFSQSSFHPNPVGYGAATIATGIGTETCPSITIPTGYQWVKVWLFRASLNARTYYTANSLHQMGTLTCNPGDWATSTTNVYAPVYQGCHSSYQHSLFNTIGAYSYGMADITLTPNPGIYFADRVMSTGVCVHLQTPLTQTPSAAPTPRATCGAYAGPSCTSSIYSVTGVDQWTAVNISLTSATTITNGCQANPLIDPFGLCAASSVSETMAKTSTQSITSNNLDASASRYDFLFIATPTTINSSDMQNKTNAALPYIPQRYLTAADCTSNPTTCGTNYLISTYGLSPQGVNNTGSFPICALQPIP